MIKESITAVHKDILTIGSLYIDDEALRYTEEEDQEEGDITDIDDKALYDLIFQQASSKPEKNDKPDS